MIERALIAALFALAVVAVAKTGESFHPMALVAAKLDSLSCERDGWSAEACARK